MPSATTSIASYARDLVRTYSRYVVYDRVVPNIEDGLKPVQRRLLWSMYLLRVFANSNYVKSAKIVGDTIGNWHPHGDSACYGALVSLTHKRYPLVDGSGNFGTPTDPPAAARYTEARLTELGQHLFDYIDVAPTSSNYLNTADEPVVLDTSVPVLLMNGSEGVAVGIAENIPPHNMHEVIAACMARLGGSTPEDALRCILGPDYGSGVVVSSADDVRHLYEHGSGTLRYRCAYNFDQDDGVNCLVVTEYAPHFNPARFIVRCNDLVAAGHLISVADETSSVGPCIRVEYSDHAVVRDKVIPLLYTSVNHFFFVLCENEDNVQQTTLVGLIDYFLARRRKVETRVLRKRLAELSTEKGLLKAVLSAADKIDGVLRVLRTKKKPVSEIASMLGVSKAHAVHVSNASLRSFSKSNTDRLKARLVRIKAEVHDVNDKLSNIDAIIENKLCALDKLSDKRGMSVVDVPPAQAEGTLTWVYFDGKSIKTVSEDKIALLCGLPVQASDSVSLVYYDGHVKHMRLYDIGQRGLTLPGVVAVVPDTYQTMVVVDATGLAGIVDVKQNVNEYIAFKNAGDIVSAVGVDVDDALLVSCSGTVRKNRYLKPGQASKWSKRRGCAGRVLMTQQKDVRVAPVRPGERVVYVGPRVRTVVDPVIISRYKNGTMYVVGERNLLVTDNGVSMLDMDATIDAIISKRVPVNAVHPIGKQ